MSKVIGIGLGTTNVCVAVVDGDDVVVIPTSDGRHTLPASVVGREGDLLVGEVAKRQAVVNAENTVGSIRRYMGRPFESAEVRRYAQVAKYPVRKGRQGEVLVEIAGRRYAPERLASLLLEHLKARAAEYLGKDVEAAVITVPAYFNGPQREAVREAGRLAGFDSVRVLNEPVAATLAYGLDKRQDAKVAVFDMGGATFDISIVHIRRGATEVLSTGGDRHLGGDDFDRVLIDHLADRFIASNGGPDLRYDKMALQRLKEAAEKAKLALSTDTETSVNLPFIMADHTGPKHLYVTVTRQELERMTDHLVRLTLRPCRQALLDADLESGDIDEVLLVGGQTNMPLVAEAVRHFFGRTPQNAVHPEEVVAVGASIHGSMPTGQATKARLLGRSPASLGVETAGGVATTVIARHTPLPARKSLVFSTAADNQSVIDVHVLMGERSMAADNTTVRRFRLVGIPPAPRGVPQLEVTFEVDETACVRVSAQDHGTGKPCPISVSEAPPEALDRAARLSHMLGSRYRSAMQRPLGTGRVLGALVDSRRSDKKKRNRMNSDKSTLETTRENLAYAARVAGAQVLLDKLVDVTVNQLRAVGVNTSFVDSQVGRSLVKVALPTAILAAANSELLSAKVDDDTLKTVRGLAEVSQLAATMEGANVLARLIEPLLSELLSVRKALPAATQQELDALLGTSEETEVPSAG